MSLLQNNKFQELSRTSSRLAHQQVQLDDIKKIMWADGDIKVTIHKIGYDSIILNDCPKEILQSIADTLSAQIDKTKETVESAYKKAFADDNEDGDING